MQRIILILAVAAVMAAAMVALASTAVAQGNPRVVEGTLLTVPACDPGEGGIRGTSDEGVQELQESEVGIGGTTCFVELPEDAVGDGDIVPEG